MKIFHLPDLGEGLAEAEIREWYVNVGDVVELDQPLLSLETAKAVVDVPAPCAGRIKRLHGKVNDTIKTHAPLVEFEGDMDSGSIVGQLEQSTQTLMGEETAIIGRSSSNIVKAAPIVRALAEKLHVNIAEVAPSGFKNRITIADVKRHLQEREHSMRQGESLRGTRRVMAQVMGEAHRQVAQITLLDDADLGEKWSGRDDITVLILQAMASGVRAEPAVNAWFDGSQLSKKLCSEINIGLAIDTPEGLFVPVLKNVDDCSLEQLRKKIDYFKKVIANRTILSAEMQGATLLFSNFGSIAGKYASPMVVPPMVAILGCGRVYEATVVRQGKVVPSHLLPLSLSADHRAVTGGEVARFLSAVKRFLEEGRK